MRRTARSTSRTPPPIRRSPWCDPSWPSCPRPPVSPPQPLLPSRKLESENAGRSAASNSLTTRATSTATHPATSWRPGPSPQPRPRWTFVADSSCDASCAASKHPPNCRPLSARPHRHWTFSVGWSSGDCIKTGTHPRNGAVPRRIPRRPGGRRAGGSDRTGRPAGLAASWCRERFLARSKWKIFNKNQCHLKNNREKWEIFCWFFVDFLFGFSCEYDWAELPGRICLYERSRFRCRFFVSEKCCLYFALGLLTNFLTGKNPRIKTRTTYRPANLRRVKNSPDLPGSWPVRMGCVRRRINCASFVLLLCEILFLFSLRQKI